MKKILTCAICSIVIFSILALQVSAFSMGGKNIYDSQGNKIAYGRMWNEPNDWSNEMYTLGSELSSDASSTLTIILMPRGIDLTTGETNKLIAVSPKSESFSTSLYHRYDIDPSKYYPTLACATYTVNGIYSETYQYPQGWNWG